MKRSPNPLMIILAVIGACAALLLVTVDFSKASESGTQQTDPTEPDKKADTSPPTSKQTPNDSKPSDNTSGGSGDLNPPGVGDSGGAPVPPPGTSGQGSNVDPPPYQFGSREPLSGLTALTPDEGPVTPTTTRTARSGTV
jgi:hypothetical protein